MASMEYQLSSFHNKFQIREQESGFSWISRNAKKQMSLSILEEEINTLRRKMEQMVMEGHEMTSDDVVKLSTILDHKINEYMAAGKKSR